MKLKYSNKKSAVKNKKSAENNKNTLEKGIILKLDNLSMKFGSFYALQNISFELKEGEIVGLIGANGAGKTTLSEIIAGLNQQTTGTIKYGFEYDETPQEKIGMQFQDATFPSGLSVKNIIAFAKNVYKLKIGQKRMQEILEIFQMDDLVNKKTRSLSGGQRQKLNILLSILHNPKIVILDELSTGLDISAREEISEFTKKLLKKHNMSGIVISHHMSEIRNLCDEVIILDKGKIIERDSLKNIESKETLDQKIKKVIISSRKEEQQRNRDTALISKKTRKTLKGSK